MPQERPVVVATRKLPHAVEVRLGRDYDARLNADDKDYSADQLLELAVDAQAILPCPPTRLDADLIARLPDSVKIIATYSVGYDHIDVAAARKRGIFVSNTPDVLNDATAEIAVLLMLAAARRAVEADTLVRRGDWKGWATGFMVGTAVTGKRLGILGMGRIGRIVARRARGFDMEVHYFNRRPLDAAEANGAIYHERVEDLLRQSEFLSIHCPASPETHHLLDPERIGLLPAGAIVVNTARGTIVDDDALIAALESGHVAAAGLDVFENEPNIDPRYAMLANTILLPHIGSATRETRDAMGFRALDNLDAYFAGKAPPDLVN